MYHPSRLIVIKRKKDYGVCLSMYNERYGQTPQNSASVLYAWLKTSVNWSSRCSASPKTSFLGFSHLLISSFCLLLISLLTEHSSWISFPNMQEPSGLIISCSNTFTLSHIAGLSASLLHVCWLLGQRISCNAKKT